MHVFVKLCVKIACNSNYFVKYNFKIQICVHFLSEIIINSYTQRFICKILIGFNVQGIWRPSYTFKCC